MTNCNHHPVNGIAHTLYQKRVIGDVASSNHAHSQKKLSTRHSHRSNPFFDASPKDESISSLHYCSRYLMADGICSGKYILMALEYQLMAISLTPLCSARDNNSLFDAVSYKPMTMGFQSHVFCIRSFPCMWAAKKKAGIVS